MATFNTTRRSQPEPAPDRIDQPVLLVDVLARVGNDAVVRIDPDPTVRLLDVDQPGRLQRRQRVLHLVDRRVDARTEFQHRHAVVGAADERVENRHLCVVPVAELGRHPHASAIARGRLTCTGGASLDRADAVGAPARACHASDASEPFYGFDRFVGTMGLRCLLGHDFSEPRTERDREVRGDEVITTITEVKECSRCGETRVVSENKEVRSAGHSQDDADGAGSVDDVVESTADATSADTQETADTADIAETIGTPEATDAAVSDPSADEAATADEPGTADGTATPEDGFDHPTAEPTDGAVDAEAEEDAEIIDADDGEPTQPAESAERGHGEWPDADANRRDDDAPEGEREQGEWPDTNGPPDTDGPHSPAEGEDEDVEFIGDDDAAPEDDAASDARTGVVPDAKRADEPGAAADPADEDAEFIDGDAPGDWPRQAGDDEGYDAEPGGDDAGVSVDGNLTPQVDPEVARQEDVEFIEADADAAANEEPVASADDDGRDDPGGGERTSDAAGDGRTTPNVELRTTVDNVDTVYVCPDCGNTEPVGASSMRAGDICPECKRGYIEERERQ